MTLRRFLAEELHRADLVQNFIVVHPKRNLWQQAFLEVSPPASCRSSFKRLTAEERAELEEMKTSRFDKESKGVGGSSVEGDNGQAVPLGFLTSVPGVSTLAGNSYVLNAVEYAKENPMTALWTAGPVVFSAVVGAARSTYNYFFPPQEGWLGGWDGGLLAGGAGATLFGGAAATTGWFGQPAPATSSWFGFGSQPAASSSWFGGGGSEPASSSWFGGAAAAGGAAAGATAGGLFGGLFGGGEEKASSSQPRAAEGTGDGGEGEGFDLEDELGMDLGDEEGCEQQ